MKKIFVILFILKISSIGLRAQDQVLHDPVSSRVFNSQNYSSISGSPFLSEDWMNGDVTVKSGTYKNILLKYDAYAGQLYFEKDENAYQFAEPVLAFVLKPDLAKPATYQYFKKLPAGSNTSQEIFVQVLQEGRLSFYKEPVKIVSDINRINEGVVKTFTNSSRYFLSKKGQISQFALGKKELPDQFSDRSKETDSFIKEHKISLRKESDFIKLVQFYNSLAQ
ncbi:hypothetical protein ACFSQD_12170 [Flavihumibacter stibioxidans]|uniref:Uncharacterized protein n=1 Tax=Flavihumibacter stibioxidans TaxID=1834163 RepID=A0ABR7MAG9_9BACT|nr:hypothetical protein [Flavihumibacter stibioxidans]MBC6491616.1 hypothetical protein [Flavihumibacter stibioxidans]